MERIVNIYVPNGQTVDSPKYTYKLEWFQRLGEFLREEASSEKPLVVCGDFNVAPEDRDVHDPEVWRGKVLFSDPERAALAALFEIGLVDLFRRFHEEAGLHSWWDYRQLGFPKNKGLRIDLILGNEAVVQRCRDVWIDREERKGPKPSDHAPVIAAVGDEAV